MSTLFWILLLLLGGLVLYWLIDWENQQDKE